MKDKFFLINDSKNKVTINRHVIDLISEASPIIWNRNGRYCVIPQAVVQNAIDCVVIWEKFYSNKTAAPNVVIMWNQGIPISNQAGRALIGE
jgi:hypothetical protein